MRRCAITCSTTVGPVKVPALAGTFMAVHHSLVKGHYRPSESPDWTVTHIASGHAMEWIDTQREARDFIEWFEREFPDELAALAKLEFGQYATSKRGKVGTAIRRLFAAREQYRAGRLA